MYKFFSSFDFDQFITSDIHQDIRNGFMPHPENYHWNLPGFFDQFREERANIYISAWKHKIMRGMMYHEGMNPPQVRLFDPQTNRYYFSKEFDLEVDSTLREMLNQRNHNPTLLEKVADSGGSFTLPIKRKRRTFDEDGLSSNEDSLSSTESSVRTDEMALTNMDMDPNPVIESPLDQFGIHSIFDLHIGNFFFSFTNSSLSMLLTLGLVLLLVFFVTKKGGGKSVPNAWQSLVELIYDFVPNLVNEQIGGLSGNVKQKFFPRISVTFTFLLFCNLQGMIPFSFTVTSHFLITLALSFSIFIGITIVGFQRHGLHFFSFLLPAGVPLPLAPFLVLLELISHCFRALSSGIRLFANMMAGHSSVKILSGFAWTMLFLNNIFYFIGDLGPLFIVLALTGLELGVAILQAHVSTISICIYLNDATNLHQNE